MSNHRCQKAILFLGAALAVVMLSSAQSSAAVPMKVKADIAYATGSERYATSRLDVYVPNQRTSEPSPVVVWIHGGGWFKGDKDNTTMADKAKAFTDAGFIVVAVNYRLSPDLKGRQYLASNRIRFPAPNLDVAQAVGWVNRHIERFGGDPGRIVLGGESAGAQIAALLATRPAFLRAQDVAADQIKGVISLDAVGLDVRRMIKRPPRPVPEYRKLNVGFRRMMINAFGTPAEEKRRPRWSAASPIRYADPTDPPIFFVVSETAVDRRLDAWKMTVSLEQVPPVVSRVVPISHRDGIGGLLGNPKNDMGVTKRVIRFSRAAVDPEIQEISVHGKRVVSAAGSATATVRLSIAFPGARHLYCRLDERVGGLCPSSWNLKPGVYTLRITAVGNTGRVVGEKAIKIRVKK